MTKEHLIDFDRKDRIGIPETIFCQDKEINQIKNCFRYSYSIFSIKIN